MKKESAGPFELPSLPWEENGLEPVISGRTIGFHYGKHHLAYVKKLNELVAGTRYADMPLERIIAETVGHPDSQKLFNNAGQHWNHSFFWNCLRPGAGGKPRGELAKRIEADFGGIDAFSERFVEAATDCFGSGWTWLVERGGALEVVCTSNAGTPLTMGATPLFTVDVWEHAYYLDYQNERPKFVKAVLEHLADWDFAADQLSRAASLRKAA